MTRPPEEIGFSTETYPGADVGSENNTRALAGLQPSVAQESKAHPFKDLDFFTEADTDDYAGREQDVRALTARVLASRTTVLYGRSGLGKTSLLRAGLFPILELQGFRCLYVRVLDSPLKDLAATLVAEFKSKLLTAAAPDFRPTDENAGLLLREAATQLAGKDTSLAARRTLLVVFDQFEEFFTIFQGEPLKRYAFVAEIASLVRGGTYDVRVMFSLREDYLFALDDFQRQLPDLFSAAYRLLPLSALGARAAIVKPLDNRGIPYDDGLVTAVLDALAPHEFESARLQLAASEIFRWTQKGKSSDAPPANYASFELPETALDHVRSQGSDKLFRDYLVNALSFVPGELQMDARTLLDLLITEGETKLALSEEELLRQAASTPETTKVVLDELEEGRLLRRTEHPGGVYYELRHECLITKIRDWQKEHRPFADFLDARSAIRSSSKDREYRDRPAKLLSKDILRAGVAPNVDRLRLSAPEMEFVLWSTIRRGLPEASEWAARWETATQHPIAEVLDEMLRNPSPEVREGASAAVARLAPDEKPLIARCVELMGQRDGTAEGEEVQLAAIESVGRIAQRRGDPKLFSQCLRISEDATQPPKVRVRALESALSSYVADKDPEAVKVWLRLALEGVTTPALAQLQRQASLGFAKYATPRQVGEFRKKLRWGRPTVPNLTILADFHQVGGLPQKQFTAEAKDTLGRGYSGLGWWLRRRARRAWEQRRLSEFGDQVTRARQAGFFSAALAGLCWYVTICLPATLLFALIWAPEAQIVATLICLSFGLLGVGLALVTGWRAVICSAEARIIGDDTSWRAAARRSSFLHSIGVLWLVPSAILVIVLINASDKVAWVLFSTVALLAWPFCLLFRRLFAAVTGVLERVLRGAISPVSGKRIQCLWLSLLMLALWVAGPLLVSSALPWLVGPEWTANIWKLAPWYLGFGSSLMFGWTAGLIISADSLADSSQPVQPQRRSRWTGLTAAIPLVLLVPWFALRHGGGGFPIPGFWKKITVTNGVFVYEPRLWSWPDVAAFRVEVDNSVDEPLLEMRASSQDLPVQIDLGPATVWNFRGFRPGNSGDEVELLWMPSREGRFILYDNKNSEYNKRRAPAGTQFTFVPLHFVHSSTTPLQLTGEGPQPVWVDFSREPSGGRWISEVEVTQPQTLQVTSDKKAAICAVSVETGTLWVGGRPLKNAALLSIFDPATEAEGSDILPLAEIALEVNPGRFKPETDSTDPRAEFRDGRASLRFELSGLPHTMERPPQILVVFQGKIEERDDAKKAQECGEIVAAYESRMSAATPMSPDLGARAAWCHYRAAEYSKARTEIEEAIPLRDNKNTRDQEILGLIAFKLGDWETAARALESALEAPQYLLPDIPRAKVSVYLKAAKKKLTELKPSPTVPSSRK